MTLPAGPGQPGQPGFRQPGRAQPGPVQPGPAPRSGGRQTTGLPHGGVDPASAFPPGYARPPQIQPPDGYAPPGPGRGRPPGKPVKPSRIIDYPRWGRSGWTRWLPSWKLVTALSGFGVLMMMAAAFAAYSAIDLPKVDSLATAQTSVIYYRDGKTPIGQLATQNRQIVPLSQVPRHVQDAVLAAEDSTFRTNSGIAPTSIIRAAWSNLRGNSQQGGSTISQQYVKNVYDQKDPSYKRKAKEIFLAVKINQQWDKDKILEDYLNTIYLGRGAYGFQAAAKTYFNTDVSKLTVSQGAFLAGIINAPSRADEMNVPKEKERATRRWGVVLDAMVTEKWLDPTERAGLTFPRTAKTSSAIILKGQNGFLKDMIVKDALKIGFSEEDLFTGGYKITSTFDARMVKAGAAAVRNMLPEPKDRPKGLNIGMATIDPKSGAVRAIFGGPKYVGPENNNATIAIAQAGSTFKAFGLIAALEDGYSLQTEYNSDSPVRIGKTPFRNASDGEASGYKDLVDATKHSLNTVYVQLNNEVGARKTEEAAHAAGIPDSVEVDDGVGNVLGSTSPHAIDMASAYATFANQGTYREPYTIAAITELGSKKEIYNAKGKTETKRVFDADAVADLTFALQQVVQPGGTGAYADRLDFPVAGKTGTSSDARSAWFVGYTPQLSTSVMMYQLGKEKIKKGPNKGDTVLANVQMEGFGQFRSVFGGGYPAMIWTDYMAEAMKGKELEDFPARADVGEKKHSAPIIATPTERPEPTDAPEPTSTTIPIPDPTTPTDQPLPTETQTLPEPTRSRFPQPTTPPTDPGIGDGGGDDDGEQ